MSILVLHLILQLVKLVKNTEGGASAPATGANTASTVTTKDRHSADNASSSRPSGLDSQNTARQSLAPAKELPDASSINNLAQIYAADHSFADRAQTAGLTCAWEFRWKGTALVPACEPAANVGPFPRSLHAGCYEVTQILEGVIRRSPSQALTGRCMTTSQLVLLTWRAYCTFWMRTCLCTAYRYQ